jgi:hypothetical protein
MSRAVLGEVQQNASAVAVRSALAQSAPATRFAAFVVR